jgi:hypothetical protein
MAVEATVIFEHGKAVSQCVIVASQPRRTAASTPTRRARSSARRAARA